MIHAAADPNNFPPASDETPKYEPNMEGGTIPFIEHNARRVVTYLARLQSVTQNTDSGLSVKAHVKMRNKDWLHMYASVCVVISWMQPCDVTFTRYANNCCLGEFRR